MTTVLWFKRDLRLADHPALTMALNGGAGPLILLYVVEPALWALPDASFRQYLFVRQSLEALSQEVAARGGQLLIRVGDVIEVLEHLRQRHGVTQLFSHEETGNLWTYGRDMRVGEWARGQGVRWQELSQSGVVRRLGNRDRWQRRRDGFIGSEILPVPAWIETLELPGDPLPEPQDLGLEPDGLMRPQPGGSAAADALLHSFLSERGETYRSAMSTPLAGAKSCSRLSPHFAFGTMTLRQAAQATAQAQSTPRGKAWTGSLSSFQSRLAWRDHFMQKLEDQPDIEARCLHSAYEGLRPKLPDVSRISAWEKGETGLPFVDACMRYLRATGWLNFRMRSMVMAVASYHLWLDWRATGPVLARFFTDYEPGIHWPQVQMQSGTTGMNTIRIYNPVKQGHDQDPDGIFTRRWVPELAEVPDAHLQSPWTWDGAAQILGQRYPEPIVDPATAARAAREAVWGLRRGEAFHSEKQKVLRRHGSRKRSRRKTGKSGQASSQLSFDL